MKSATVEPGHIYVTDGLTHQDVNIYPTGIAFFGETGTSTTISSETIYLKHIGTNATTDPTTSSTIGANGATFNNLIINRTFTATDSAHISIGTTTDSKIQLTDASFSNATISTFLDANGTVTLDGTKVLKTVDVQTSTDATYLTDATLLGQQIVNKKYVDEQVASLGDNKADKLSTSTTTPLAYVDKVGQY